MEKPNTQNTEKQTIAILQFNSQLFFDNLIRSALIAIIIISLIDFYYNLSIKIYTLSIALFILFIVARFGYYYSCIKKGKFRFYNFDINDLTTSEDQLFYKNFSLNRLILYRLENFYVLQGTLFKINDFIKPYSFLILDESINEKIKDFISKVKLYKRSNPKLITYSVIILILILGKIYMVSYNHKKSVDTYEWKIQSISINKDTIFKNDSTFQCQYRLVNVLSKIKRFPKNGALNLIFRYEPNDKIRIIYLINNCAELNLEIPNEGIGGVFSYRQDENQIIINNAKCEIHCLKN